MKNNITVDINTLNIEMVEKLIYLIEKHYENMPSDLKELIALADETGFRDYDVEQYAEDCGNRKLDMSKIQTSLGEEVTIISANKYLKTVRTAEKGTLELDSFWIKCEDVTLYEW